MTPADLHEAMLDERLVAAPNDCHWVACETEYQMRLVRAVRSASARNATVELYSENGQGDVNRSLPANKDWT